jgi:NADH dehydrogenase
MRDARPHVLIIGGGFGGLESAKALARAPVRVTLVDARNHHLFQPLLYQVAMAGLSPADIALPIRTVLRRRRNVTTLMGKVTELDLAGRTATLSDGVTLGYDFLILAAGARTNFFGHDAWAQHAFGLKSVEDALAIRRQVLLRYEEAERGADPALGAAALTPEQIRARLTFVVIGGGPTGVELAGALAELGRHVLAEDYRHLPQDATRVVLLEAGPRILGAFTPELSAEATRALQALGVEVRSGTPVQDILPGAVVVAGERLEVGAVIWSAGVEAVPLTRGLGVPLDRAGRVLVNPDCSIPGHPEAFAVGDIAHFKGEDGQPLPGVSPVAMQQARWTARNITRRLAGAEPEPFRYFDKGIMATIGRSHAVAQTGRLRLSGGLAWLAWLFVHLWYLVGFKNRVFVFLSWIWSYMIYRRGARLITEGAAPPAAPQAPDPAGSGP